MGCQIPFTAGTAATCGAQNADAPRKRRCFHPSGLVARFQHMPWTEFRACSDAHARFTVRSSDNPRSGGRPDGNRNAEERDRRRSRYGVVGWPLLSLLMRRERKRAYLVSRSAAAGMMRRFSVRWKVPSLERLNPEEVTQLYGRRGP